MRNYRVALSYPQRVLNGLLQRHRPALGKGDRAAFPRAAPASPRSDRHGWWAQRRRSAEHPLVSCARASEQSAIATLAVQPSPRGAGVLDGNKRAAHVEIHY
jgi:hypothetical protein